MNDGTKSALTALFGIIAGVALTIVGVNELGKRVISAAEEVGKLKGAVATDQAALELLRDEAQETKESVISIAKLAQQNLMVVESQKARLEEISSEVSTLFDEVDEFQGDEAREKMSTIKELLSELNENTKASDILGLRRDVRSSKTKLDEIVRKSEREYFELLSQSVCAARNNQWDYGRTVLMESPNTCNAVCGSAPKTVVDKQACVGMVLINEDQNFVASGTCDYKPIEAYFTSNQSVNCCCY